MGSVDPKLLEILVCPLCKGKLVYRRAAGELVCKADRLAYPVKDDVPLMLEDAVRKHGHSVVMTRSDHESGTDRLAEAAAILKLDAEQVVVNVQGDEPLIE